MKDIIISFIHIPHEEFFFLFQSSEKYQIKPFVIFKEIIFLFNK
jgi:hypothetical protein